MPKYSANLASPFTIGQLADQYKTAFDTLGWGTGKVSIQGGYRFTSQQADDSADTPISITPDGAVAAPDSITSITGADWVDNYAGKVYVYPVTDGHHRWPLLFYLPGLRAFRITFTPVHRADGADSGPFSDLDIHAMDSVYSNNASDITTSARAASLKDSNWGSDYTIGQSYTTLWSHDALGGDAEVAQHALIYAKNVVLRIDKIEYIVTPDAFGVQGPNLDGPLFEFRFLDGSGYAYGVMQPLPVKDAYRPRVILLPPHYQRESGFSHLDDWKPTHLINLLFNAFREDDLQQVGIFNSGLPVYAVVKHYSYGADLNVFLASNDDHRGFALRSVQSGSSSIHVVADRVDKSSIYPANPTTVPERREHLRWLYTDYDNYSTATRAPARTGWLIKVEGQTRILQRGGVDLVFAPYSNTYTFALYRVSRNTDGELIYEEKVADIAMTGNGTSGVGKISFDALGLSLDTGYYLLVPPSNLRPVGTRGIPSSRSPVGTGARMLGPVVCRDLSDDSGWTAGSTVLNVTGNDFSIAPSNASIHGSLSLWLEFDVGDTPSNRVTSYAEDLALVTHSPGDSTPKPHQYELLPLENTEYTSNGNWAYGAFMPFILDRALAGVEPGYVWQLSPLPGWFSGARGYYTTARSAPTLEFEPDVTERFPAWMDRPYRDSLPLERLVMRPTRDVAAGNSHSNADGSEDFVAFISRRDSNRPWSVCFHVEAED